MQAEITGVILAGGRGSRMGGIDKGLQLFNDIPLTQHALLRLQKQVDHVFISANRNLERYGAFGVAVVPDGDGLEDFAGPLAGVLAALGHCTTPLLLTVPCDAPLFPDDLAVRLASALKASDADIAVACAPELHGAEVALRQQPVFSLMKVAVVRNSVAAFTQAGGRKVSDWMAPHRVVLVAFDQPHDAPDAFFNANTLAELKQLQQVQNTVK